MALSLFERCGGFAKVRRIVTDFYDKLLESPRLAKYFADTDMRILVDHQTKFIAMVMGGPASYSDDALRRAHAGMGITRDDYRETVELICETLEDHGIDEVDVELVRDELMQKEDIILGKPPTRTPTAGQAAAG